MLLLCMPSRQASALMPYCSVLALGTILLRLYGSQVRGEGACSWLIKNPSITPSAITPIALDGWFMVALSKSFPMVCIKKVDLWSMLGYEVHRNIPSMIMTSI